jgi:hypothetical protein
LVDSADATTLLRPSARRCPPDDDRVEIVH